MTAMLIGFSVAVVLVGAVGLVTGAVMMAVATICREGQ